MGQIVFTGNDGSGGVHVNPVDDSGTQYTVDAGQILTAMIHQSIHQGPCIMSGGRMDHHPLGFVHHNHILVLIKDIQGNVFRKNFRLDGIRYLKHCLIAFHDPVAGFDGLSIDENLAGL